MKLESFNVLIMDRDQILYRDQALAVSSHNESGQFDILAQHANFISLISKEIVVKKLDGSKERFQIDKAVMRVLKGETKIFLGFH